MASFYIDGANAPDEIKDQLKLLAQDIEFEREVTKGGNGYLFFGRNRILNTRVAVKFYYWGGEVYYHAEPNTLANIHSPNILEVHNAGLIDGEWAYFVTPFCPNGDMDDVIERTEIGNKKAVELTCQLLMGVGSLHEQRYLHRDLKPANIYVGDDYRAIIGDFGSIKQLPQGLDTIPSSSHAVLYRPPESIETNSYGFKGDIYQCGIVLYQLLGGSLPYDEISWMSKSERKHYNQLDDDADRSIYADQCVKAKIRKGKVLNLASLPPWVPDNLRRAIRKATNLSPEKRFPTASAFHVYLNNLHPTIPDWLVEDGCPTLRAGTSYRVYDTAQGIIVKKRKGTGQWRKDNSFNALTVAAAIGQVNEKA